jgi:hypothetical protein
LAKEALEVFLSSDQKEFSKLRGHVSNEICSIPFLSCTPLEETGADPSSVLEASLKAVRESDVYLGVFGREYSETTIKEYARVNVALSSMMTPPPIILPHASQGLSKLTINSALF